jgi:WD40 repeat protein
MLRCARVLTRLGSLAAIPLTIALLSSAKGAELTAEPMLRIEAGMHTAPIPRIGLSSDGTLLTTASGDKTVRLWSLPTGKLLRTLRLPIDAGHGGKIFAVALSPNGRIVAAGRLGRGIRS